MVSTRFARFLMAGGAAAVVNFASRFLFSIVAPYGVAVTLAYLVGMVTAFLLNRHFVFSDSTLPALRQFRGFVLVNVLALVQTLIVSIGLGKYLLPSLGFGASAEPIAHAIGIVVPVVTSYLGHRRWSFGTHS